MFSINTLQEIIATLSHNKLRTVLTGLSVSWGIFILIVLLGAGNGLKNGVTSNFSQRATNTVQMWSGMSSLPFQGLKSGRTLDFSEKQLGAVDEKLDETTGQTGIIEKDAMTVTYKTEYGSYSLRGVNPLYKDIFNLKFESNGGRFINDLDLKNNSKVIVIDKKIEEVLFKGKSSLGQYLQVGAVMFKVVGVNSKKERWGSGNVYIHLLLRRLFTIPIENFIVLPCQSVG